VWRYMVFGLMVGLLALLDISFAQQQMVNPLCSAFVVLNQYWGLIKILLVGIVLITVLLAAVFNLVAGKVHWTFVIFIGGIILLLVAWQGLDALGKQVAASATACK